MASTKTFTIPANSPNGTPTRVRQAYLPLTTTFTPERACTDTISLSVKSVWQNSTAVVAVSELFAGWFYSDGEILPSSCIPLGNLASTTLFSTFYYSPGICPYGYTTVRSIVGLSSNGYEVGETGAVCCPEGYDPGPTGRCVSSAPAGRTVVGLYSVNVTRESGSDTTITSINRVWNTTLDTPATVVARDLSIRFKEGDFPVQQSGSSDASTVIAVAVVIPIVVLAVLIAFIVLWLRKKRKHRRQQPTISNLPEVMFSTYTGPDAGDKMIAEPIDVAAQRQNHALGNAVLAGTTQSQAQTEGMEVIEELPAAISNGTHSTPRDDSGDKEVIVEFSATPRVQNSAPHDVGSIVNSSNRFRNPDHEGLIPTERTSQSASDQSQQATRMMLEQELRQVQSEREQRELEQLRRREQEILVQLQELGR